MANTNSFSLYRKYAWFVLGYCVAVILWGAYVRASGSGAGCGAHWPLCNGTVMQQAPQIKTLVEFSHRITSGLSLLLIFALFLATLRFFPSGSFQRKAAGYAFLAIILEALIGAVLVLARLVEHDQSIDRVISISFHLVNTLFLLGALTITAMAPSEAFPRWRWPEQGKPLYRVRKVLFGFAMLGALGAITALGDTLFPVTNLGQELHDKFAMDGKRHFLQQMRMIHPLLAVIWAGAVWVWLSSLTEKMPALKKRAQVLLWLVVGNLTLGFCNVLLLAPVGIQILHLLWAEVLWILLVSLVFSAASRWPRA